MVVALLVAGCTPGDDEDDPEVETLEGRLVVETEPSVDVEIWIADIGVLEGPRVERMLSPGEYRVCFGPSDGSMAPPCEAAEVEADATTTIVGSYAEAAPDPADEPAGDEPTDDEPAGDEPIAPDDGQISHGTELRREDVGATEGDGPLEPSGPIETVEDGQVIENYEVSAPGDISAAIVIGHDDVVVRNVKIASPGSTSGIRVEEDVTGTVIERATIDGMKAEYGNSREDANWGSVGIVAYSPVVARRNDIFDVRQAVQLWDGAAGSTVVENYVRRVWPNAPGVSTAGINYRGSQSSTDLTTISRNRVTVAGFSGISAYAESGPVRNLHVLDNLVVGTTESSSGRQTGYGIRGGYVHGDRDNNRNIRIEGNRFAGRFEWGTNGAVNVAQPGNTFADNRRVGSDREEPPQLEL